MILLVSLRSGQFRLVESHEVTGLTESGQYRLATAQEQEQYTKLQKNAHSIRE